MRRSAHVCALLATAAALFSCQAAVAQSVDGFDWSGPYVGVNAGAAINGDTSFRDTTGDLPNNTNALNQGLRPVANTVNDKGFTGGAQIGYNLARQGLLLGVEADLAYTDLDKSEVLSNTTNFGPLGTPSATPVTRDNQYRGKLDYLGTVRARLGLTFDRLLVYGTGGLAYGRINQETIYYGPNAGDTPFFAGRNRKTDLGGVYGGGVEFAMPTESFLNFFNSSAVTVKAEYLHYDLGYRNLRFPGVNGGATIGGYNSRVRTDVDLVRAGINYKF
ncbi:outer membrane immunogenic protein [Novosphingobium chloroacetimidivorans]|uniref:Outer membrane immunogenic protein n=1 Tax=Novosphingobium chloroacetimidivorans TaxID=1428314 RepID=A0A7W7K943_9SPHN|nr:outer membrane beta-barrel protein [Novosphingobium chloroacetimidivorans]MBB4858240.1 outer membrane immunogenic protein [Novosphingobium chloroacetimidivorans]